MLLFLFCAKVQRLEGRVKERLCDGRLSSVIAFRAGSDHCTCAESRKA